MFSPALVPFHAAQANGGESRAINALKQIDWVGFNESAQIQFAIDKINFVEQFELNFS